MGRPYRGYIGYGPTSSMYEFVNPLGGIITQYDRNVTLAGSLVITGGTVIPGASTPDGYDYHVFTESGDFTIAGGDTNCDLMIIAGGGGGGGRIGGGGGAGGYLYLPNVSMAPGTHAVVIGGGGAADPVTYPNHGQGNDQKGNDTTIGSYKAWGGGGGSADNGGTSTTGGSGGGGGTNAGGSSSDGLNPTTPSPIISSDFPGESHPYAYTQGYPGGPGPTPGGGGGAGGQGGDTPTGGGVGKVGDIPMPPSYGTPGPSPGRWFCGGGGGSGYPGYTTPPGGAGGGGAGGYPPNGGTAATAQTGGGGGAGGLGPGGTSGAGGSGICVVRVLV